MLFSEKVIDYTENLSEPNHLPEGINVLSPLREDAEAIRTFESFYRRFYSDENKRYLILGINPGRFGAGITAVPFTDTKRLKDKCHIEWSGRETHEPSSVFVYEMIDAFGGVEAFYARFFINSVYPFGFTRIGINNKPVNLNYYDRRDLQDSLLPMIEAHISSLIQLGCHSHLCYCLGTGSNYKFLNRLNKEKKYFGRIIPLEHPRYVMQYRSKEKQRYIADYLGKLGQAVE